jgi:predicted RND superfamily exporter protein
MGLVTAMIIAIALIFDFLFLPALLIMCDRKKRGDE